jgi:hypothetical protein
MRDPGSTQPQDFIHSPRNWLRCFWAVPWAYFRTDRACRCPPLMPRALVCVLLTFLTPAGIPPQGDGMRIPSVPSPSYSPRVGYPTRLPAQIRGTCISKQMAMQKETRRDEATEAVANLLAVRSDRGFPIPRRSAMHGLESPRLFSPYSCTAIQYGSLIN